MPGVANEHRAHYELMADVFKCFGHPLRIRILEMVAGSDQVSVGEFLEELGVEPSHLSHQLSVLRRQRLIAAERRGNQVSYRLAAAEVAEVLSVGRTLLAGMAARVGDVLQAAAELPPLQRTSAPASISPANPRRDEDEDEDEGEEATESVA